jgi:hypothetical protein
MPSSTLTWFYADVGVLASGLSSIVLRSNKRKAFFISRQDAKEQSRKDFLASKKIYTILNSG